MLVTKARLLLTTALLLHQSSARLRPAGWALISLLCWGCHISPCGLTGSSGQSVRTESSEEWVTTGMNSGPGFTQGVHTNSKPCLLSALLFPDWHSGVVLLGSCHSTLSASSGLYDSGPEVYFLVFSS